MARDGFGTYSVPNTFLPNTVMSATAVNQNFTDAGTEITNSLARDGQSSMSGQFKAIDGTATSTASAVPGIAFGNDPDTGFRRASSDEMRWMTGGVDRFYIDSVGKAYQLGALEVVGTVTMGGPVVIATSSASLLNLRRTENDTTARTIEQYQSGSGAGAKGDVQIVGGGSNNVATMRWRVNSIAVFEMTQSLFTHSVDVAIGSNIDIDADGFIDLAEITAPSSPGANVGRVYAVDSAGVTRVALKDSGGNITLFGQVGNRQQFDSSDTWTRPPSGTVALIQAWGGGASGGAGGTGDGGGGGGGGAYSERYIALASLSASVAVTIGAGGTGQATDDTDGNAGGDTTFGAYLSAFGGGAGSGDNAGDNGGGGGGGLTSAGSTGAAAVGGAGGGPAGNIGSTNTAAAGNSNPFGGGGGSSGTNPAGGGLFGGGGGGFGSGTNTETAGGFSVFGGGGGGGGADTGTGGAGGTAIVHGGNGGAGATGAGAGTAGTAPGGGGGGSETGTSGAGAAGRVVITVW
jgi:hypothetical protein